MSLNVVIFNPNVFDSESNQGRALTCNSTGFLSMAALFNIEDGCIDNT
jgi:hypothetical protein